jgi:hypothetical protein
VQVREAVLAGERSISLQRTKVKRIHNYHHVTTITKHHTIFHLVALPKSPLFCDDSGINPDEDISGGDDTGQPKPGP